MTKFSNPSLRGAQQRSNPARRMGFSGLSRFAHNDGMSGAFASGGQGKQPCTHITFTAPTPRHRTDTTNPSLRGVQRRGNPARRMGFSGLLRYARNDGISGPFASGGQGKQPCTHITFTAPTPYNRTDTPSLRGVQRRGNPSRRIGFSGLSRFAHNAGMSEPFASGGQGKQPCTHITFTAPTPRHRTDTTNPSLRGVQQRSNPARRMGFSGLSRFARNAGMSGPFASGGQGKQPCTHITFTAPTPRHRTDTTNPSLRGAQHRGNPSRRIGFSGLPRFARNDEVVLKVN